MFFVGSLGNFQGRSFRIMDLYRRHTLPVIIGYNNRTGGFYAVQKIFFYGNAAFLYVAYSHRSLGNVDKYSVPEKKHFIIVPCSLAPLLPYSYIIQGFCFLGKHDLVVLFLPLVFQLVQYLPFL